MYCNNCGYNNQNNTSFCNKCGRPLSTTMSVSNITLEEREKRENIKKNEEKNKKINIISILIGIVLSSIVVFIIINYSHNTFHFINRETNTSLINPVITNKTVVETDNVYSNVEIETIEDAIKLIKEDSNKQKDSCPNNVKSIEELMINNFDIKAVNLCEMSYGLAVELYQTMNTIYKMFPSIKGNITNITIGNFNSKSHGVIAFYQPLFPFAQSKDYKEVYKMRIVLNARFFLNENLLNETIKQSSLSGYFPPNANITSPIAHELGHYISFYAMRKNNKIDQSLLYKKDDHNYYLLIDKYDSSEFSKQMLEEPYKLYLDEGNTQIDFDKWRETISQYAVTKNESGKELYDETIAEAFHDVYLNKDNAKLASKYIIKILKKYVEES